MTDLTSRMDPVRISLHETNYADAITTMNRDGRVPLTLDEVLRARIDAAKSGDPQLKANWWNRAIGTGSSFVYTPGSDPEDDEMLLVSETGLVEQIPLYVRAAEEAATPNPEMLDATRGVPMYLEAFQRSQRQTGSDKTPSRNHILRAFSSRDVIDEYCALAREHIRDDQGVLAHSAPANYLKILAWPHGGSEIGAEERWTQPTMWPIVVGSNTNDSSIHGASASMVYGPRTVPIVGKPRE